MNTSPPAVAIDPPPFTRPVFFLPSGSSSVTPNTMRQANSPVFAFTAVRCPHGGFWQGHDDDPSRAPLASVLRSQNFDGTGAPYTLRWSYGTRALSGIFSIQPMLA